MKNNALKLLSLALVLPMMTACPKPKKPVGPTWSEEVSAAMTLYAGEVLPYLNFDEGTLTYGYNDFYSIFYVYDDNEADVTEDYADKLLAAGFEAVENDDGEGGTYVTYDKTNDLGFISVDFGWMEADEDVPAGNFLNVSVPQYLDEELLEDQGYTKQTGFPTDLVELTLEGSGITLSPLNENGEWFVADELYEDEEGSYYCAYLATKGDYFDAIYDDLTGQGLAYYDAYGLFYDEFFNTDAQIYVTVVRDFITIDIFGQTLEPVVPTLDYQGDALDQTAFGLTDGASTYGEHTATGDSGATYSAQCASSYGIQIRSKNSTSGILGTNTAKTCESIKVLFESHTQSGRTINVYGSDTAFTIGDMYSSMTPVGTIVYNGNAIVSYEFTAEYNYIGLRSADGAIYMLGIDVVWSD